MPTKIPSPGEVGLPPKFDKWRKDQEEAIQMILDSPKRVTGISMPTGKGKSVICVAAALLSGDPTCIITHSRSLEDQYMRDFESIGMVDIRGRNNYSCDMHPEDPKYTCEQGYATRCMYKGTIGCECSRAEMKAASSSLVVTNYAKWCAARKFGQGMSHFTRVIMDEGDCSYEALSSAMQVVLSFHEINDNLKVDFPDPADALEFRNWKTWCQYTRQLAEAATQAALAHIIGIADPKPTWVKHYTHMKNLTRRLGTLSTASANEWIVEGVKDGYQFDPIHPGRYAEGALLMRVPKITFISATLKPKSLFMVGIGKDQFDFKEFNSDFDPKRCPIYYLPAMRVDARSADKSMLYIKADQILSKRRDRKGLVQTTSYDYQRDIKAFSRFTGDMLGNDRGEVPTEIVEQYKSCGPGTILVSPSIGIGTDFPDDDARYNIILKIPFEPPSKILKAREEEDKEYRNYRAMQKLVQQLGRDVRSKGDWSERFILDEHFSWFYPRNAHHAPASFHGFIKAVDVVPTPPRLEDM